MQTADKPRSIIRMTKRMIPPHIESIWGAGFSGEPVEKNVTGSIMWPLWTAYASCLIDSLWFVYAANSTNL